MFIFFFLVMEFRAGLFFLNILENASRIAEKGITRLFEILLSHTIEKLNPLDEPEIGLIEPLLLTQLDSVEGEQLGCVLGVVQRLIQVQCCPSSLVRKSLLAIPRALRHAQIHSVVRGLKLTLSLLSACLLPPPVLCEILEHIFTFLQRCPPPFLRITCEISKFCNQDTVHITPSFLETFSIAILNGLTSRDYERILFCLENFGFLTKRVSFSVPVIFTRHVLKPRFDPEKRDMVERMTVRFAAVICQLELSNYEVRDLQTYFGDCASMPSDFTPLGARV
jgi:hypothetical protein